MLELAKASLCWGCQILLVVPIVQLPTPGVAWEDVHPGLVGENILSTNHMPLKRKLPSGLAERVLGPFPSSRSSSSSSSRNRHQSLEERGEKTLRLGYRLPAI